MKKIFCTILLAAALSLVPLAVGAAQLSITSIKKSTDGVQVTCKITNQAKNQRITLLAALESDSTSIDTAIAADQFTPTIQNGSFTLDFAPAAWKLDGNVYLLRIGGDEVTAPAEAIVAFFGDNIYSSGDVNGDGNIDNRDAALILKYSAGLTSLNTAQLTMADIDKSGVINITDAVKLFKLITG